ncbi:tetratricopeptide repeat protein [Oculatella sp. FACHB-28]|uniref:CHAT domain-containing protein n=1 Tax=Oculatella sp. FACHB-28 TaxID=2692845 RepID=UPI0018EFCA29|nr:tetratricopeptide repeat protein [Oculatella sp. FACHB-28]
MRHPVSLLLCTVCLAFTVPLVLPPASGSLTALAQTTPEDRIAEADRLLELGNQQYRVSQWQEALQSYQAALDIYRNLGVREAFPQESRAGEAITLNSIGAVNDLLGNYPQALEYYEQSLALSQELGDRAGEAATLGNIGIVNDLLGNYPQALEYYEQSLAIKRELGDRAGEAITLNNIGSANRSLGNYPQALEYYEQSLAIKRELGDRAGEAATLGNIGIVNDLLGNYPQALEYYEQSLAIKRELGDRAGEAITLNNIGIINYLLGNYPQALQYYEQSLALSRELGDRAGEAITLGNIGIINYLLGNYPQALEDYEQSLALSQELSDRAGEAITLNNIGIINYLLGNYPQALGYYEQSLAIKRELGDRAGEANTLANIGYLLEVQEQPELAIVFFKQAVNRYETIRETNRALVEELQESYTATIEDHYRRLADLLLQQDRILEAQQVLDLLKVQELDDYLREVRGEGDQLVILRPEQEILARYDALQQTAIQLGQERAQLQRKLTEAGTLTAAEEQRLDQLIDLQAELNAQFEAFFQSDEIETLVAQLSPRILEQTVLLENLVALQDDLAQLNAVLLYPLILDDRLELVLITPDAPPIRRVVPVGKNELNQGISEFLQALRDPTSDATVPAQQLHQWLIAPLEEELRQANIQTIIYAPDGVLRYIPLAALHDGEQWLTQRYRVNNITARSLTELTSQPTANPRVLAGAFADDTIRYVVPVDGQPEEFGGLPFTRQEVENLATTLPNTVPFFDNDFSLRSMQRQMGSANILHLATHAAFVQGTPEDSFILFGNGDRAVLKCPEGSVQGADLLQCINTWSLSNIDLVVLSACQTGVGELGNGAEILGLGYQFQDRGANAVLASLWKVSDGGTQTLMDAFYVALQQPGISKTEALRLAQVALITGNFEVLGVDQRSATGIRQRIQQDLPAETANHLNHPYYWAPFILIGNGL